MNIEQSPEEYLESLESQIKDMEPLEKICSHVVITLGRCVAELMNQHNYAPISEMERVINDIFKQAKLAREQTSDIVQ